MLNEQPGELTAKQVCQYTRDYILDLFGSMFFVDSSRDLVMATYLQLLDDFDQPRQYNWGGAILTLLYRNLCVTAERNLKTIWRPTLLLQYWCWSRLPTIHPRFKHRWTSNLGTQIYSGVLQSVRCGTIAMFTIKLTIELELATSATNCRI